MGRDRDLWPCDKVSDDRAMHSLVITALKLAKACRSKVQTN